jgi:hypothetical protein
MPLAHTDAIAVANECCSSHGGRATVPSVDRPPNCSQLWAEQGERGEARDLLAPVYDWLTERFDTADLEDAKALLDELRLLPLALSTTDLQPQTGRSAAFRRLRAGEQTCQGRPVV